MSKLFIIGSGPGDMPQRILNTREKPLAELTSELKKNEKGDTVVLVSGDSGFYSVAKTIINDFSDAYDIEAIPGVSSIQYMSAKLKIPYDDATLISLHGRNVNIVPKVAYNKKVFALTGGVNSPGEICRNLVRYGLSDVKVSVGERLSYPDESITTGSARELSDIDFNELSVIYIENPGAAFPHTPLKDSDFIRGDVPMTKEEVRWLSINKLGVSPLDIIFDIGAGTGSVSVEMARKAFDGFVYAIESNCDACELIRQNVKKHGAFNIEIVQGEAPRALENLPVPDKAFIGGSSGNMEGILEKLTSLNPGIKIVANAVTLQTLNKVMAGFEKYGVENTDIISVNIARSKKIGGYDMMTALNPVYIITGEGKRRCVNA